MLHDLKSEMNSAAESIEIPPGDVRVVTERGQQSIRRRRSLIAVALLLIVGVSAAGGWSQLFGAERDVGRRGDLKPAQPSETNERVKLASGLVPGKTWLVMGYRWRVFEWISEDRELCTRLEIGLFRESACARGSVKPAGPVIRSLEEFPNGGRRGGTGLFGRVGPEVAEVVIELGGGRVVQAQLLSSTFPEYEGVRHFFALVPHDVGTVIAKDVDGRTLERQNFGRSEAWGSTGGILEPRSE